FIGSMGNIPLAALLFDRGVSFAGVMAFIFSDLVVLPVLRINAAYYGWKMALYILLMLLSGLVLVSLAMHYGFSLAGILPDPESVKVQPSERAFFDFDYGFVLNILFLLATVVLVVLAYRGRKDGGHEHHDHGGSSSVTNRILRGLVVVATLWLVGGLVVPALMQ
ncbi:MAG: permease, partial [Planctomycetota bacterium]